MPPRTHLQAAMHREALQQQHQDVLRGRDQLRHDCEQKEADLIQFRNEYLGRVLKHDPCVENGEAPNYSDDVGAWLRFAAIVQRLKALGGSVQPFGRPRRGHWLSILTV